MATWSVGVKNTPEHPIGYLVRHATSAFIVEADTAKKAKNAVERYAKEQGMQLTVVDAVPAERLPVEVAVKVTKGRQRRELVQVTLLSAEGISRAVDPA